MQARNVVQVTFHLDSERRLKPVWLALFHEFPDRFVICSDEIIPQGDHHPSAGGIQATVGMLKQLPDELQRKMGYENAYRLYNKIRQ